jgi:L-threonylcarbamoyladenylate synthase
MLPIRNAGERGALAHAAAAIKEGKLVGFPTETVYGLAAAWGHRGARIRLARVKGRRRGQPFQLLLSHRRKVRTLCGPLPAPAARLAREFWPGPLTLVVPGQKSRWLGLRLPDHPVAVGLARRAGGVIVSTSANLSGERPARTAEEVAGAFEKGIALVLDDGPAPLAAPSSVVRVGRRWWQMLREGAIARKDVARIMGAHPERKEPGR